MNHSEMSSDDLSKAEVFLISYWKCVAALQEGSLAMKHVEWQKTSKSCTRRTFMSHIITLHMIIIDYHIMLCISSTHTHTAARNYCLCD
jgi:hypothetical protein